MLLAIEDDDWTLADMLASQARAQIGRSGLDDYPTVALSFAVSALVRSRTGRLEGAAEDLGRGSRLLQELKDFPTWYEAETMIALARTSARLDDVQGAKQMLGEASRLFKDTPGAVVLGEWIGEASSSIEAVSASAVRDLTPAELRVLHFLPTHFSFGQIADQTFVSAEHREDAGSVGLPETRGQLAPRGSRAGPGCGPARP